MIRVPREANDFSRRRLDEVRRLMQIRKRPKKRRFQKSRQESSRVSATTFSKEGYQTITEKVHTLLTNLSHL